MLYYLCNDFNHAKRAFLVQSHILKSVVDHSMPSFLIVNSDETGLKLIPQSEWTMEKEGATESTHKGLNAISPMLRENP